MLLISESAHEDHLTLPVCALLQDLGIEIQPVERKDSFALVFWEIADLYHTIPWFRSLSSEEKNQVLTILESDIRSAMIAAGFQAIEKGIEQYKTYYS